MKDEQKVWIRGIEGRGSEVRKMLVDLGATTQLEPKNFELSNYIYYISHRGDISYVTVEGEWGQIIMDNYRELHLPEQWNDGDLLVHTDDDGSIEYVVYKETKGFNDYTQLNSILTYANVNRYTYGVNVVFDKDKCKLASDEEHEKFYKLLHKHKVDWNAEKKQLVKWRYKPKKGDSYFYINHYVEVIVTTWMDDYDDQSHYNAGNCFHTHEKAEKMVKKIKNLLNAES